VAISGWFVSGLVGLLIIFMLSVSLVAVVVFFDSLFVAFV
jgi:hypothetical protein